MRTKAKRLNPIVPRETLTECFNQLKIMRDERNAVSQSQTDEVLEVFETNDSD
jgi:hypothetical protein